MSGFFFFFNIYLFPCARSWLPHVGSRSLTRDWPRAFALGAWSLSRWTTKEAPVSGFFFLASCFPGSPVLWPVLVLHSFLWPSHLLLCGYITEGLTIDQVRTFRLFSLLGCYEERFYEYLHTSFCLDVCFHFSWLCYLGVELLCHCMFNLLGNCFSSCWLSHIACGILVPWLGIEPVSLLMKTSPNPWTAREFPWGTVFQSSYIISHSHQHCTRVVIFHDVTNNGCNNLDYSLSWGCEVAFHCDFDPYFSSGKWCWTPFQRLIECLYVFFEEMSVETLCQVFN